MINPRDIGVLFLSVNKQDHIVKVLEGAGIRVYNAKNAARPINLDPETKYLARYGSRADLTAASQANLEVTLNRKAAIKKFSNKLEGRNFLTTVIGAIAWKGNPGWNVPKTIDISGENTLDEAAASVINFQRLLKGKKVLIRKHNHTRGNSLWLANGPKDIRTLVRGGRNAGHKLYVQQVIQKEKEYRVYFFFGKILAVFEKVPNDRNNFYWGGENADWEYRKKKDSPSPEGLSRMVGAIGQQALLDFGAIDVITDKEGQVYALEVNTCFEMQGPYLANKFVAMMRQAFEDIEADKEPGNGEWVFNDDLRYQNAR